MNADASPPRASHYAHIELLTGEKKQQNAEYKSTLKTVYAQIDKDSNLYWSHKDETQLIRGEKKSTRSRLTEEAKEEAGRWEKNTDAQFGYGEITKGALMNLLTVMQNGEWLLSQE